MENLRTLGIMNHTQRHWRATQLLSSYMKQFDHQPYYFMSQRQTELRSLDQQSIIRKQGEVDAVRLSLHEANKAKTKKELIRRLNHHPELGQTEKL